MKRFFYVYILVSEADTTTHYTGMTQNLQERLREHNRGVCPHSSKCRPWRLETAIAFQSESKHTHLNAISRAAQAGNSHDAISKHIGSLIHFD